MNDVPPSRDPPEELDESYRRASNLDPSRPSESVRRAVLNHAAQLAEERRAKMHSMQPAGNRVRWRSALFGTLAAAAIAGLLVTPHFLGPRAPSVAAPPATIPAAPPTAPARARESAPQGDVSAETSDAGGLLSPPPAPMASAAKLPSRPAGNSGAAPVSAAQNAPSNAHSLERARASASAPARPAHPADPAEALRGAAEIGDIARLHTLLEAAIDIDARDAAGRTALMLATLHGQTRAVDALLASGADPNAADAHGATPLQAALAGNEPAIIAALRRAGAR